VAQYCPNITETKQWYLDAQAWRGVDLMLMGVVGWRRRRELELDVGFLEGFKLCGFSGNGVRA